jgi:hypothetical protein
MVPYALMLTQLIQNEALQQYPSFSKCEVMLLDRIKQIRESEDGQKFTANTIDIYGNINQTFYSSCAKSMLNNGRLPDLKRNHEPFSGPFHKQQRNTRPESFDVAQWNDVKKRRLEAQSALVHAEEMNTQLQAMCFDMGIDPNFDVEEYNSHDDDPDNITNELVHK